MNRKGDLREFKGFIIDLDGVVWLGQEVVPGAPEAIKRMRERGKQVTFVSNNSVMSSKEAIGKLQDMGIEVVPKEVIMASHATAQYISNQKPGAAVLVVGLTGLAQEMAEAGLMPVAKPELADFVVVGNDLELNYEKLTGALRAILNGAKFIAVNDDGILPTEQGFCPGAGASVGAITGMIKRDPDKVIGKPHSTLVLMALERMQLSARECALIGDSFMTDILLANRHGIYSILVLSGNTGIDQLNAGISPVPNCVLPSIAHVSELL